MSDLGVYFFPTLLPEPSPVAAACPVRMFKSAVPVPVPVEAPPLAALAIPTF